MPLPNFLIIGAAKSGTTSLFHYLKQHPEVFMSPNKEPRFFAFEGQEFAPDHPVHKSTVTTFEEYRRLFDGAGPQHKARGEASPSYLSNARSIPRIEHYLPDVKLIAILRNPVERAYSHYLHALLHDLEPEGTTFEEAIHQDVVEFDGYVRHRPYIHMGLYGKQLTPYFEHFDRDRIRVFLFEDLRADEVALARTVYRFLGVDDTFTPDASLVHAKTGRPRNRWLHGALRTAGSLARNVREYLPTPVRSRLGRLRTELQNRNLDKPEMSAAARRELVDIYREDILVLQDLLDRDLSRWLRT